MASISRAGSIRRRAWRAIACALAWALGGYANAQSPPQLVVGFNQAQIALSQTTLWTIEIDNINASTTLTGIDLADTLPAGLAISPVIPRFTTCSGSFAANPGTTAITLSGASLAPATNCIIELNVVGIAAGAWSNSTGSVTSTEGGAGFWPVASLTVVGPPVIAPAFNPATVAPATATSLTYTIANPAANTVGLTGIGFTDTLPTGLTVTSASASVCNGGTLTTASPTGISLSGAALAPGGQCQFGVTVTTTVPGTFTYASSGALSNEGGFGSPASADLLVGAPPTTTQAFGAPSIGLDATTTLTVGIANPNAALALTGIAFTDGLPAGLVVAATPALSNTCGGTIGAVAGASSVSLAGATLAANASCAISLVVQGTTSGVKSNSLVATSTEGGAANPSSASLTVVGPPLLTVGFNQAQVMLSQDTLWTIEIDNTNVSTTLTGITLANTLPAGLAISFNIPRFTTCSGSFTANPGSTAITLSGASLAPGTNCIIELNVEGVAAGAWANSTGSVASTEGGAGFWPVASLTVVGPPVTTAAFTPSGIVPGATTSLAYTITNPDTVTLTGIGFTDTLPAGLTLANASASACNGGTLTTTSPTGISLSGATLAPGARCQFSVSVTATAAGSYMYTTSGVLSNEGGVGSPTSTTLNVADAPTIAQAFGAPSIAVNATTSLAFTIANPNAALALSGVAFVDSLPAGLVVAAAPAVSNACGGTISAVAGASSVSLAGATLAANASCTVSLTVQGMTSGVKNNSVAATSTQSGYGNPSSAALTVVAPPAIGTAFGAAAIALNGSTSLSFTLQNNNVATSLSGIAFTDALPAGLVVSTPNGLAGSCGGGTVTAAAGTGTIALAAASLLPGASCAFAINVTAVAGGAQDNNTGSVSSIEGGIGAGASASLSVLFPPAIASAFTPPAIALLATTSLTFTITNPAANGVGLTGVGFTDTLPAGLTVASASVTACGGALTTTAPTGIALANASVARNGQCQFSVTVAGGVAGNYTNTTSAVASTNAGPGNTTSATLAVGISDLSITKTHSDPFIAGQAGAAYAIVVTNAGTGPTIGAVSVADTLPAIANTLVPTDIRGTGWACVLATLTCTRSDPLAASASYPPITLTVDVPVAIQRNFANTATVSGGAETNVANDTASDATTVVYRSFTGPTPSGGVATASFTGGGPACGYSHAAFIALSGGSGSPPAGTAPQGYVFPEGLFDFATSGCTPGASLAFTITYAGALPPGTVYWKYGPNASDATPHWYILPSTISGNTVTFTIADGGLGDDDLAANGTIVDPGGPGVPGTGPIAVPTLSEWATLLLAGVLALSGMLPPRRRRTPAGPRSRGKRS